MKVAVIGCTHAGTAAILNTKKLYPEAEITVFERNETISFLSCGIALYVGGIVKDANGLFYCSPEALNELGVETKMQHDVLAIDADNKTLQVRNLLTSETFEHTYDKLIMTTGSWPIIPQLPGIELANILLSKNYDHAKAIISQANNPEVQHVVIVGAGYIGVELVEAFEMQGKKVTLVDVNERVLSKYLDTEFTTVAEQAMQVKGITLALGECVEAFEGKDGKVTTVVTNQTKHQADLVIMCIGFRPNTQLLQGQVEMLPNGAILVDEYMRSSNPDILAAGDSAAIYYNPTQKWQYIPLATNAVRMGTLVAHNLVEPKLRYMGTQGTSGIKVYADNYASTGLTAEQAKSEGLDVSVVSVTDAYRPEFMPTHEDVTLKLVYRTSDHVIVGAQLMSKIDLTAAINTISLAIQTKTTIEELAFVDFFFQPHYNKPWNLLNLAGLEAMNVASAEKFNEVE
ncbi:MAG: FAD-dependent oxidoreductase [Culicoidibacterales bacterium]